MRTANQLTFTTYEASLKLKPNDPTKITFDNIDWSFIHPLVKNKYSGLPQGVEGYDPIPLFKAQLFNGNYVETPVYDNKRPKAGIVIAGPAIKRFQPPPSFPIIFQCKVDDYNNYIITRRS